MNTDILEGWEFKNAGDTEYFSFLADDWDYLPNTVVDDLVPWTISYIADYVYMLDYEIPILWFNEECNPI